MLNLIKWLIIGALILTIVTLLSFGYMGFIPQVAAVLGSNKPRDLGIEYSEEAFRSGLEKSGVELKPMPEDSDKSLMYEGSHQVETQFTDEELTSHAAAEDWKGYPLKSVQIRINNDDTAEITGMIEMDKLNEFLEAFNISKDDYKKAMDEANLPFKTMPFYIKGTGFVSANKVNFEIMSLEIGRFKVPEKLVGSYQPYLASFGEKVIETIDGLSVDEARFVDESLYFKGSLPDMEYSKK